MITLLFFWVRKAQQIFEINSTKKYLNLTFISLKMGNDFTQNKKVVFLTNDKKINDNLLAVTKEKNQQYFFKRFILKKTPFNKTKISISRHLSIQFFVFFLLLFRAFHLQLNILFVFKSTAFVFYFINFKTSQKEAKFIIIKWSM